MEPQSSTVDEEDPEQRWYRREQACEAMNISLSTLHRAIRSGELAIKRIRGGIILIGQSEIDRYNRHHPVWIQPSLFEGRETGDTPIELRAPMTEEGVAAAARVKAEIREGMRHSGQ